MPLGIHRNILDFEILETGNELTLIFVDSSQYMEPPDRPLLEVRPPGYDKYLLTNVIPNQVNTFNSNILGLQKALHINHLAILPDGAWSFRYKICPYNYVFIDKRYFRTTIIQKKIEQVYNHLDLEKCTDKTTAFILDQLTRVQILLQGAKSIVDIDIKRAFEYYQLANRLVEQLLDKHCKNCNQWGVQHAGNRE